ncbi:MAG TPA: type II secretion system F family protein [Candidatus Thermoplasmatota archaeon]|nr:type II secretion system F family protein [Candidatus Thermoplasmatota archaeon]
MSVSPPPPDHGPVSDEVQRLPLQSFKAAMRAVPTKLATQVRKQKPLYREKTDAEKTRFIMVVATSVCGGLFFLFLSFLVSQGRITHVGPFPVPAMGYVDFLALAFLATALPLAIHDYSQRKRIDNLEERLPDFLTDLASLHRAGMTLKDAILVTAQGYYGALTPQIQHIADQIRWNVPVLEALEEFRRRVRTPLVERTLTVVIEAGRSGGNVTEVLDLAALNARNHTALKRQRKGEMLLYTAIVYVAFMVFLAVVASLQGLFVPRMLEAVNGVASSGMAAGPFGAKGIPTLGEFRGLFFTVALIQAVGNGFVAGMIGEGSMMAGFKHAAVTVGISLIAFLALGPAL